MLFKSCCVQYTSIFSTKNMNFNLLRQPYPQIYCLLLYTPERLLFLEVSIGVFVNKSDYSEYERLSQICGRPHHVSPGNGQGSVSQGASLMWSLGHGSPGHICSRAGSDEDRPHWRRWKHRCGYSLSGRGVRIQGVVCIVPPTA